MRSSFLGGPLVGYRNTADRGFHLYATTVDDPYSGWMLLSTTDVDKFDEEWDELFAVDDTVATTALEREWIAELAEKSKVERAVPPATTPEGLDEYLRLPRDSRLAARDRFWAANSQLFPPPAWFVKHFEDDEKRRFTRTLGAIVDALGLPKDPAITTVEELFAVFEKNKK